MDSITQIVLGAAVGEAVLGGKEGKKGAIWGAILGTLPDLDVLSMLWLDPVTSLTAHRSASHSFIVAILVGILLGVILKGIHRRGEANWTAWVLMVWLVWISHIFLDLLTVYGTQIWWPLSHHHFSLSSIFVIDPFYTLPLAMALWLSLRSKVGSRKRFNYIAVGLILSSLYLTWGMSVKAHVHSSFRQGLASRGLLADRLMTAPGPMSSFVWMGLAQQGDSLFAGTFSILDSRTPSSFTRIPRNSHLLAGHQEDKAVQTLLWFTKGWYSVQERDGSLIVSDYRFGRSDFWLEDSGEALFRWKLKADSTGFSSFEQITKIPDDLFRRLGAVINRAKGRYR